MEILFIIRADAQRNLGGDTIQMLKTKAALEELDLTVEVRGTDELERLPACDLAHVFNIQTADSSWAAFEALQKKGIPTVLSSIYWDMLDHWFDFAVDSRFYWRWLAQLLGKVRARQIYTGWQRRKASSTQEWQTQRRLLEQAIRVLPNSQSEGDLLQKHLLSTALFSKKLMWCLTELKLICLTLPLNPANSFWKNMVCAILCWKSG
ncbi:MAG: hypothetical protein HC875_38790 [Anaerolineales bacterium]|nr:hypothetical protein [Anaerolineales bacterium]